MNRRVVLTLCALLAGIHATGCAAITASRTDTLNVISNPQGAEIRLNGVAAGRTPGAVEVTRKTPEIVEVVQPGYDPQRCPTTMQAGGGYIAGDILLCVFLFPIGCISWIDAGGYWNTLVAPNCAVTLNPVQVQVQPLGPPPVAAAAPGTSTVAGSWPAPEQVNFIKYCVDANQAKVKERTRDLCTCALDDMQARYPNTSIGLNTDNALAPKLRCAEKMGIPTSDVQ